MRGLLTCCKWEFLQGWAQKKVDLIFYALWLVYGFVMTQSVDGGAAPLLLSFHLIAVTLQAAVRAVKWPYSQEFCLERTSGWAAWQSVGGRVLCWAGLIAVATGVFQGFIWLAVERSKRWTQVYEWSFAPGELAGWISVKGFLTLGAAALGGCVLCLLSALWMKSDKSRHRAKLSDSLLWLSIIGMILWSLHLDGIGLLAVGAACLVLGLPLCIYLLAYRVE